MKHYKQFVQRGFLNRTQEVKPAMKMDNLLLPWPSENIVVCRRTHLEYLQRLSCV